MTNPEKPRPPPRFRWSATLRLRGRRAVAREDVRRSSSVVVPFRWTLGCSPRSDAGTPVVPLSLVVSMVVEGHHGTVDCCLRARASAFADDPPAHRRAEFRDRIVYRMTALTDGSAGSPSGSVDTGTGRVLSTCGSGLEVIGGSTCAGRRPR